MHGFLRDVAGVLDGDVLSSLVENGLNLSHAGRFSCLDDIW